MRDRTRTGLADRPTDMPSASPHLTGRAVIAIDVGGTKVAGALVTPSGKILHRIRQPTALQSADAALEQVVYAAQQLAARTTRSVVAVGVSIAAVVDPSTGDVRWAPNLPGWRNIPLGSMLSASMSLPTTVVYDGHAAVVGEHWRGAGRGARNVVFLTIGTGIGGGLVLDGRLYHGASNLAGAAGWMIVDENQSAVASRRKIGGLESVAAGPGLVISAERAIAGGARSSIPTPVTTHGILAAADAGDPLASSLLEGAGRAVGLAIVGIVSVLNPDVVIIGGGLGIATGVYVDQAKQAVAQLAQPVSAGAVRIVKSELADDAPLLGAARLALRHASRRVSR
jgi:glucokinase